MSSDGNFYPTPPSPTKESRTDSLSRLSPGVGLTRDSWAEEQWMIISTDREQIGALIGREP
jgi:hypothetical protein